MRKYSILFVGMLVLLAITTIVSAQNEYEYFDDLGLGFGICAGAMCFIPIIWLIIWILVGIWVYKDAEKRGKSGILWLLIVIILGIIGIIIWLVVRPPIGGEKTAAAASDRKCPNCGRPIPMDARVCPYCNKKFEE